MEKVVVNEEQCRKIAGILNGLEFRKETLEREYITFASDKETKLRAFFYSVAICHQTHSLIDNKRKLKGWTYLEYVYANLGKWDSKLIDPFYLSKLSVEELIEKLKPLFSEDGKSENCTLDRLDERAKFIIDDSKMLVEHYGGKVENVLEKSNGFLIKDGEGLYELLEEFESYSDHLRKKSGVLIKFLILADFFEIKDLENIVPIMDYQIQRVLLRTGCIEVLDKELKDKLVKREQLESDEDVRQASIEASRLLFKFSGKHPLKMDDFLWALGRSCCRTKMLCVSEVCDKDPCTFFSFVQLKEHKKCVFDGTCKGSQSEEYRKLYQPIVETHYY